jgi:glutathione synthase/RimK-type ligase-like ATP-grasp enzyme
MSNATVAIHSLGKPIGFAPRWIEYCEKNNVTFRLVNCLDSNIINEVKDCDILLWHFNHNQHIDLLVARHILTAISNMGVKVFPDYNSSWHFDDKIAQKYIFESLDLPHIRTHCFYSKQLALEWIETTKYPFVWKLKRGAGSRNVRLVENKHQAIRLCNKAFGDGFCPVPSSLGDFKSRTRKVSSFSDLWSKLKRRPRLLIQNRKTALSFPVEKDYFLTQDFLPGNTYDTRITIIDGICWGFTRSVRKNDFRASGSGDISYDQNKIDPRCLEITRMASNKIGGKCLAFDFINHPVNGPQLVEMSYAFVPTAIASCPGHWDSSGKWKNESLYPEDIILNKILELP